MPAGLRLDGNMAGTQGILQMCILIKHAFFAVLCLAVILAMWILTWARLVTKTYALVISAAFIIGFFGALAGYDYACLWSLLVIVAFYLAAVFLFGIRASLAASSLDAHSYCRSAQMLARLSPRPANARMWANLGAAVGHYCQGDSVAGDQIMGEMLASIAGL